MVPATLWPEPRVSDGARRLNLILAHRPAPAGAEEVYILKDVFTTINGSWEPSDHPYSIPQWARDTYLRPSGAPDVFDDADGDHHLFARLEDAQGQPLGGAVRYWSADGSHMDMRRTDDKKSGWANLPIWASFVPERGERGPWLYAPANSALPVMWVDGAGLPGKQHVSLFAVWRLHRPQTQPPTTNPTVIDVTVTQPNTLVRIHSSQSYKIEVDYAIQY
jgi:hypothetical protein